MPDSETDFPHDETRERAAVDPADDSFDDWRTGTAERPRIVAAPGLHRGPTTDLAGELAQDARPGTHAAPADPPPVPTSVPGPVRFPLYADDADAVPEETRTIPAAVPLTAYAEDEPARRSPAWLPWVVAAAVLALVAVLGAKLLLGGSGDPAPAATPRRQTASPQRSDTPSSKPSRTPSSKPSTTPSAPPTRAQDVAGLATASAPRHAPSSVDAQGNRVTFVAGNLVDGRTDTCWREPGDGSGTTLTVRLDQPTRLTKVGLVNGYAKVAYDGGRRLDWYAGNRRVTAVRWTFDDGSSVVQRFGDRRAMETRRIPAVKTSTVKVTILSVTAPGRGPAARNYTAVSELRLVGSLAR